MSDAIVLNNVTKTFGAKVAVQDLDLRVAQGALCGFIGPNGAGKTTTLRMIMSILFPDSGRIAVLGRDSALDAKDRIGYLPEERGVYKRMKVGAFLRYVARLKGVRDAALGKTLSGWLERLGLPEVENKNCEELSKGMQQKVQFLATILHQPDLLILDEPFSGLDPVNMRLLRQLIQEQHRRGATIIFSTHVMIQAEEICDHLIMIHDGRKVLDGTLDSIRQRSATRTVLFEPMDPENGRATLARLPEVEEVEGQGNTLSVHLRPDADPVAAMRAMVAAVAPLRVELHRPSLEDIFVDIVRSSGGDPLSLRRALRRPDGAGTAP